MAALAWQTLTPHAKEVAQKLFSLYDADRSGTIENPEFMSLCRAFDPSVDPALVQQSYRSVAGPTGLDVAGLAMWMMNAFGATEEQFCQGGETLIRNTGAGVAAILPAQRQKRAQKLFRAYDADGSSFIDVREFTTLCKQYDPQIDEAGVQRTFEMVGASGGRIDIVAFYRWVQLMFGDCTETEFEEGLDDLLVSATSAAASKPGANLGLSANSQRWASKLFRLYDKDNSGDMSVAEFTGLCKKYDPSMSESSVKLTFETSGAVGGVINLQQFLQWCVTMFGTEELGFEDSIRELLSESGDQMNKSMPPKRRQWARQIFSAYDVDRTGLFDLAEFSGLYRSVDPNSTHEFVQKQFETAGGSGSGMDPDCFERWLMLQYGELNDANFERQVQLLLDAARQQAQAKSSRSRPNPAGLSADPESQERMQAVQADIARFEAQKAKLQQDTAAQEQAWLSKQSELQQVQQQVNQFKATAQQLQAEVIPLSQRKRELETSVLQQQQAVEEMESKVRALQSDLKTKQQQQESMAKDGESKALASARKIEEAQGKIVGLETQLSSLNSEVADGTVRSDHLKKELAELEATIASKQQQESEWRAKEKAFEDGIVQLKQRQDETAADLEQQRTDLTAIQAQISSLQSERSKQEESAAKALADAESAAAKCAQEETRIAELESQAREVDSSLQEKVAQANSQLEEETKAARAELEKAKQDSQLFLEHTAKEQEAAKEAARQALEEQLAAETAELKAKAEKQHADLQAALQKEMDTLQADKGRLEADRATSKAQREALEKQLEAETEELKAKATKDKEKLQKEIEVNQAGLQNKAKLEMERLEKRATVERQTLEKKLAVDDAVLQQRKAQTSSAKEKFEADKEKLEADKAASKAEREALEKLVAETAELRARGEAEKKALEDELAAQTAELRSKQKKQSEDEMRQTKSQDLKGLEAEAKREALLNQLAEEEQNVRAQAEAKRQALAKDLEREEEEARTRRDEIAQRLAKELEDEQEEVKTKKDAIAKELADEEKKAHAKRTTLSEEGLASATNAKAELQRLEKKVIELKQQEQEALRSVAESKEEQKTTLEETSRKQKAAAQEVAELEARLSKLKSDLESGEKSAAQTSQITDAATDIAQDMTWLTNSFNGLKHLIESSSTQEVLDAMSETAKYMGEVPDAAEALEKLNAQAAAAEARAAEAKELEKMKWDDLIAATRAQKAALDNACVEKEREVTNLNLQLETIQEELQSKESEKKRMSQEMDDLIANKQARETQSNIDTNGAIAGQAEPANTAADSKLDQKQQEIERMSSQEQALQEVIARLRNEIKDLELQAADAQTRISKHESESKEWAEKLDVQQRECEAAQKALGDKTGRLAEIENSIKAATEGAAQLETRNKIAANEARDLEAKNEELLRRHEAREKLQAEQQTPAKAEQIQQTQEVQQVQARIKKLQKQLDGLSQTCAEREHESKTFQRRIVEQRSELENLQESRIAAKSAEAKIGELTEKIDNLEANAVKAKAKCDTLNKEREEAERLCAEARTAREEEEAALEAQRENWEARRESWVQEEADQMSTIPGATNSVEMASKPLAKTEVIESPHEKFIQQVKKTIDSDERVKALRDRISKYHGDVTLLSQNQISTPQRGTPSIGESTPSPLDVRSLQVKSVSPVQKKATAAPPYQPVGTELFSVHSTSQVEAEPPRHSLLQDLRQKHAQVNVLRNEIAALRSQTSELTAYQSSPGSSASSPEKDSPPTDVVNTNKVQMDFAESTSPSSVNDDQRTNRLSQLRQRLQEQYGSPPGLVSFNAVSSSISDSPSKGEKSFDDLVGVCIRLREELDEQRSALLSEFEAATIGSKYSDT